MCNAWNDRLNMVQDEHAFLLPFGNTAQSHLENFVLIYRHQTVSIFAEWLNQDFHIRPEGGNLYPKLYEDYCDTVEQAKTLLRRLDEWNTQYQKLERTEITGAEYWHIVQLMEDLIDTMDDNTMSNFVKMQQRASNQYKKTLEQAMTNGGYAFDRFRDGAVKVLHSEIDKQRLAAS